MSRSKQIIQKQSSCKVYQKNNVKHFLEQHSWLESKHPLKTLIEQLKQRSGQRTLARKKYIKKILFERNAYSS